MLKFFVRLGVGLTLVLVLGRWGWARHAEARLERELARYRAAGEAIDPSDFDRPAPPDEENAAVDLLAAAELIDGRARAWRRFGRLDLALPLDEVEVVAIGAVLQSSRDALRRVDAAMTKPTAHLKDAYRSPTGNKQPVWWALRGDLPSLLRAAALRSHQLGDDRDAMARVRQLFLIASVVEQDPSMSAHWAGVTLRGVALDVILQVAPDLRLGDGPSGDVAAAGVRAVIDELTDDEVRRRALVRSLKGERLMGFERAMAYADGRADLFGLPGVMVKGSAWVARPFALNDAPIVIEHYTRLADAAGRASHWPGFLSGCPNRSLPSEVRDYPLIHPVANSVPGCLDSSLRQHFQGLTEQHLAATALAVRCYAADHADRAPSDLDELVPAYMPAIPTDPMASGGRRLGYLPRAADPVIYSVGEDGTDDGGDDRPMRGSYGYARPNLADWSTPDLVIHLARPPRVRGD